MDYRTIDLGDVPAGLSEADLKRHIATRKGVHLLKVNAATTLHGLLVNEPPGLLTPESVPAYLNEMLEAGHDPDALARQLLVEQIVLSRHTISNLMVQAARTEHAEAQAAYLSAVTKLQSELRKNLKHLGELKPSAAKSAPNREVIATEDLVMRRFADPESQEHTDLLGEKSDVSELSSKPSAGTEVTEPTQGGSRADKSCQTTGAYAGGPPASTPGDFASSALGALNRPENRGGKTPISPKRPVRQERVEARDRPGGFETQGHVCSRAEMDRMTAELAAK